MAQPHLKFRHYTPEDGLPGTGVFCLLQDHQGFIWVGTTSGLSRFDGRSFMNFKHIPEDTFSLVSDQVGSLFEDREKNLWIGTNAGLNRFDRKSGKFYRYTVNSSNPNSIGGNAIHMESIVQDEEGNLWIGTGDGGLSKFNPQQGQFTRFRHDPNDPNSISSNYISGLYMDRFQNLWIGAQYGLDCMDLKTGLITHYSNSPDDPHSVSKSTDGYTLTEDTRGNLWACTYGGGICMFDRSTGKFIQFKSNPLDPHSVNDNEVNAIKPEKNGNLWAATQGGGLNFYDRRNGKFFYYLNDPTDPYSIGSNNITALIYDKEGNLWTGANGFGLSVAYANSRRFNRFLSMGHAPATRNQIKEDKEGKLWFGVPEKGLFVYNPKTGLLHNYIFDPNDPQSLSSNSITSIEFEGENYVWIGTNFGLGGLNRFNRKTGKFQRFFSNPNDSASLSSHTVFGLLLDKNQHLWISTKSGLNKFAPATQTFIRYLHNPSDPGSLSNNYVQTIMEDRDGMLWICSLEGLNRFNPKTGRFKRFFHQPDKENSLRHNLVHTIFQDKKGRIWVGTEKNGIDLFDPKTQSFQHFLNRELESPVQSITEDDLGNLWLGAAIQGLVKFNPDKNTLHFFDQNDGLLSQTFPTQIPLFSEFQHKIYFNNNVGIIEFDPDDLRDNGLAPPVFFTSLKTIRHNRKGEVEVKEEDLAYQDKIIKSHSDDVFIFQVAVLSFSKPHKNRFAYQMEGASNQWIQLGMRNEITFANLRPGKYTLRVKGANGDGSWNPVPKELEILILPPWYWSWWSKLLYFLLFVFILMNLIRYELRRQQAKSEAEQLQKLDQLKSRFFKNTAHELRTPLTIILGIAHKMEEKPDRWFREGLHLIKKNGQELLQLVNRVLDLAKLDAGMMTVHLQQADLAAFLRVLAEMFRSYAESKNLAFELAFPESPVLMDFDSEKMKDIVSNLLSNAIKFSKPGGRVILKLKTISSAQVAISVIDNGIGIPEDKLPFIFNRFFQADDSPTRQASGTGIGLDLTQELVVLLGGAIHVESREGEGTTFTVVFPIRNAAPLSGSLPAASKPAFQKELDYALPEKTDHLPSLLIVEDNPDMAGYLQACLEDHYQLIMARDGQKGIDMATEFVPDMVLSDVMMPIRDGFDLCRTLKTDVRTSHIPVILLTARADLDSRLEGLEYGADAYLAKPFNERELEISLRKALELRKRLQDRYKGMESAGPSPDDAFPPFAKEDEFIRQFHQVLEGHFHLPEFSISELAGILHMHPSNLRRKVKALLDNSPQDYLLLFRLAKARRQLLQTNNTILSIAMDNGFNDQAYFSKAFKKHFGVPPGEFRRKNGR